jgi:hypothetical protein
MLDARFATRIMSARPLPEPFAIGTLCGTPKGLRSDRFSGENEEKPPRRGQTEKMPPHAQRAFHQQSQDNVNPTHLQETRERDFPSAIRGHNPFASNT